MAGKVAVVASTAEQIVRLVVGMVAAGVLARIVERDQIEPLKERLDAEIAALVRTLPRMDQFASVVAAAAAV